MATSTNSVNPALASITTAETVIGAITLPQGVDSVVDGVQIEAAVYLPATGTATAMNLKVRQVTYTQWEAAGFNIPPGTLATVAYAGAAINTFPIIGPPAGSITNFAAGAGGIASINTTDFNPLLSQGASTQAVYVVTGTATTAAITPTYVQLELQTNGVN